MGYYCKHSQEQFVSCEQDTTGALRAAGRRCTIPRMKVANALRHAGGHLTAEDIHALVVGADREASVALSTIYRTLETLKKLRLVAETSGGTRATYEWVDREHPHYHLSCTNCGGGTTLMPEVFEDLAAVIRRVADFEAHLDHVVVSGLCGACARALADTTPD